jgi:uncharacterized membrane protein (UPF0127 family)
MVVGLLGYLLARPMFMPVSSPAAPASAPSHVPGPETPPHRGEARFLGTDGRLKARVFVEIVDDDRSRALGLMYRRSLGSDFGMLFVFDSSTIQSFWMKNTILPLDMLFVDERGRVVTIHRDTRPYSEQTYVSTKPALYVVEVNAGFSKAHGLQAGDRMEWSRESVRTVR